jgi:hypothetical protein
MNLYTHKQHDNSIVGCIMLKLIHIKHELNWPSCLSSNTRVVKLNSCTLLPLDLWSKTQNVISQKVLATEQWKMNTLAFTNDKGDDHDVIK